MALRDGLTKKEKKSEEERKRDDEKCSEKMRGTVDVGAVVAIVSALIAVAAISNYESFNKLHTASQRTSEGRERQRQTQTLVPNDGWLIDGGGRGQTAGCVRYGLVWCWCGVGVVSK
jgi:hypothetical protein